MQVKRTSKHTSNRQQQHAYKYISTQICAHAYIQAHQPPQLAERLASSLSSCVATKEIQLHLMPLCSAYVAHLFAVVAVFFFICLFVVITIAAFLWEFLSFLAPFKRRQHHLNATLPLRWLLFNMLSQ